MTTPVVALPLSIPEAIPAKKKRVLLLDTSQTKRDLRADMMRQLGIEVDCAADVLEARCWWRADLYNLVLISVAGGARQPRPVLHRYSRGESSAEDCLFRGRTRVSRRGSAF